MTTTAQARIDIELELSRSDLQSRSNRQCSPSRRALIRLLQVIGADTQRDANRGVRFDLGEYQEIVGDVQDNTGYPTLVNLSMPRKRFGDL
jgi:hypothetical protein